MNRLGSHEEVQDEVWIDFLESELDDFFQLEMDCFLSQSRQARQVADELNVTREMVKELAKNDPGDKGRESRILQNVLAQVYFDNYSDNS